MASSSMFMACSSPSALVFLAVALLMSVSASRQAHAFTPLPAPSGPTRAPRPPTPAPSPAPPTTPAPAPAPSSSQVCPTGFSSLTEFNEAFVQYAPRRMYLLLVPAGSPESGTRAMVAKLRRAGLTPCVCHSTCSGGFTGSIECEDA